MNCTILRNGSLAAMALLIAAGFVGCNSGGRGDQPNIPGLVNAAAPLPFDNAIYRGPRLERPRYGHTATTMTDGKVLVAGGSDERHFTSLDSAEIFDQSIREDPAPESITGSFVDTDFNGDPIIMTFGGRVFHTATQLPDSNVLICGGTFDILVGEAIEDAEIFDRQTRLFAPDFLQIENTMIVPRFRHTATLLSTGRVLIAGGQESVDVTIIDPNWPPGHPLFMIDIKTFPSTEVIEIFNPSSLEFEQVFDLAGDPLELQTVRGRSGHATIQIAGPDNLLGTGDDLYLFGGGIRTLSPLFAPQTKFHRNNFSTQQVNALEYFDRSTLTVRTANSIDLLDRVNTPRGFNLGQFTRFTPDGVDGMANVVMFTHGDDDGDGDGLALGTTNSELLAVTFTGFGPSNGIQFQITRNLSAALGIENAPACMGMTIGRTEAPAVIMPYERLINGDEFRGNWVITGGGFHVIPAPPGVQIQLGVTSCVPNDLIGIEYFDPFYNQLVNFTAPVPDPTLPSSFLDVDGDFEEGIAEGLPPTGVVGSWLYADAFVPEDSPAPMNPGEPFPGTLEGTGPTPMNRFPTPEGIIYHSMSVVPGADGISETRDDRVVIIGGGTGWIETGDEPVSNSCLIFLPAGAND